jgi:hypothetical protein
VREDNHLGAKSFGEEDGVVAQTTETDDADLASLADVVPVQRAVRRHPGAEPAKVNANKESHRGDRHQLRVRC